LSAKKKNTPKEISNRSATFHFAIESKYEAGMVLQGTEVKSVREGKVSFNDSFVIIHEGEVLIKSLHIQTYSHGVGNNHDATRDRKLLLHKKEIQKIGAKVKEKGFTIIPLRIYFSESNKIKIEIALARGKKLYDKRDSIKERDVKRDLDRRID
jgi:SsrA-binding protein